MRTLAGMLLLAACGDGRTLAPPADAPLVDERGVVRIQVVDGDPDGLVVFFQGPASSGVLATRTDESGRANAVMAPGGSVSVIVPEGGTRWIYSYLGVEPGDEILLDRRDLFGGGPQFTMTISIPPAPGALVYELGLSCESFTREITGAEIAPLSLDVTLCDAPFDVIVIAYDAERTRYLYRSDAVTTGAHLDITGTYHDFATSTVEVTNVPPLLSSMIATQRIGNVSPRFSASIPIDARAGSATLEVPLAANARMLTTLDPEGPTALGVAHAITWGPATDRTAVDFARAPWPVLTRPLYDHASHAITWTEDTSLPGHADATMIGMAYFRAETATNYQWLAIAPRGTSATFPLPVLPDDESRPLATEVPTVFTHVGITSDGGYAPLRTRLLGRWQPPSAWPIDSDTGLVLYQDLNALGLR